MIGAGLRGERAIADQDGWFGAIPAGFEESDQVKEFGSGQVRREDALDVEDVVGVDDEHETGKSMAG